jgi:hypothetical protein
LIVSVADDSGLVAKDTFVVEVLDVTALEQILTPVVFGLDQNFPNPFNPATTIEFSLAKAEFTELKVFNVLGKEVAKLISRELNSGKHTYTFDARNLASGVYYYQLVAGEYRAVKKMILLR